MICKTLFQLLTLQENPSLKTNFSVKNLLVTIVTNLDINLQNKKLLIAKTLVAKF